MWYLKQLLPLTYVSKYQEGGKHYVSVWKMWFGRCYKHRKFEIVKEVSPQGDTRRDKVDALESSNYILMFLAACMPILLIIMTILLVASLKYYGYL